jgi:hypothetical protein
MTRNRDTSAEAKLQSVITTLETSDELNHPSHHQAIRDLVLGGPFLVNDTFRAALAEPDPEVSLWRAEFVQFLRTLARTAGRPSWSRLGTVGLYAFSGALVNGRVSITVDSQRIRDVALLNLMARLHEVGLRHVRRCEAPDCQHLFVKTYRRGYCSTRCQQRHNKQKHRAELSAERERRMKRHRVARTRTGS